MQKKRSHGWKKAVMQTGGLCLLLLLLCSTPGLYAQNNKLTVQWKEATLQQACQELEKLAGIHFSYNETTLGLYGKRVTLSAKEASLKQVLDKMFAGTALNYTQKGTLVVLTANATDRTPAKTGDHVVTGKITDEETGAPLAQATVAIGRRVTLTAEDGSYQLTLPDGQHEMKVSTIGYGVKLLPVVAEEGTAPITLNASLSKGGSDLNEVVVIGYGKQSRRLLTSSIATVQSDDFNKGNFNNPAQLLQGKVAGLNITRSGDPNGTPSITLRGPSTLRIGAAQEPFYVIDDIPGADFRLVAPDDIASIDVLKDASATAIYGTRASNGVIIITTKKGRTTQTQISYNNYVAVENVANKIKMMNADERLAYLAKNNLASDPTDKQGANTDWQKEVSQTAVSQNHHLGLTGGSKSTTYSATANYFNNKGILKNTALTRLIGRINVEQKALNDHLKIGLSVVSSASESKLLPDQDIVLYNMLRYLPTVPVKQSNGAYTENLQRVQYYNPVSLQNNAWQNVKNKLTVLNATAQVLLPYGFKYDINGTLQNEQVNSGTYYTKDYALKPGLNGQAYRSSVENSKKILESFLTFDKKAGAHNVNVLAGYSWQEDVSGDGFQASNQNFPTDNLGYTNIGLGSPLGNFRTDWGPNNYQKLRLISFYGRANYNYKNRYLLQASLRRDASSAFGVNNRWATFPAGSFAWRVINEPFMAGQELFSDLKMRVGYGITGNSLGFNPLISKVRYGYADAFYNNGTFVNGIGVTQNANPDLKWEKTEMFNIGADFTLFKGKLSGTLEYYNKKTKDLIWYYPVSTTQYFVNTYTANVGAISNKGFELTLDASPVQTRMFKWNTSLNISHNSNKLLSLSNDKFKQDSLFQAAPGGQGQTGAYVQILKAGYPVGQFFSFKYAGKNDAGQSLFYDKKGATTTAPANFQDYYYLGNAQPAILLGWNNTFTYGKFDLNIFLRSSLGGKIMNATLADLNRPYEVVSYNLPVFSSNESAKDLAAYTYSDRFIESASYLRVDNVTLGYTFTNLFKTNAVRSLRVYMSGNNLAVITGYRGIDPEVSMGGLTPGVDNKNYYPRTRSFLFGINVSL